MKTDLFQSREHCWFYTFEWHIECSTLTASSFGIWNTSVGIPSPPLALFIVMVHFLRPTWCEELTHWKRTWCLEWSKAEGEGDDRGWDGWMASLTQWIWTWASSGSWWWTGKPGCTAFHWVTKNQTQLSDWTEVTMRIQVTNTSFPWWWTDSKQGAMCTGWWVQSLCHPDPDRVGGQLLSLGDWL